MCNNVGQTAAQKEEYLGELQGLTDDFGSKKDTLVRALQQVENRIAGTKASQSSLQGVKDLIREIEVRSFSLL